MTSLMVELVKRIRHQNKRTFINTGTASSPQASEYVTFLSESKDPELKSSYNSQPAAISKTGWLATKKIKGTTKLIYVSCLPSLDWKYIGKTTIKVWLYPWYNQKKFSDSTNILLPPCNTKSKQKKNKGCHLQWSKRCGTWVCFNNSLDVMIGQL